MVHCVCVCVCARVCRRAGGVSAGSGRATPSFQGSGGLGEGNTPISTWDTTSPCVSAPQRGRFLKQTQGPHRI